MLAAISANMDADATINGFFETAWLNSRHWPGIFKKNNKKIDVVLKSVMR